MEPAAIGPKTKMGQKVSLKLWKMSSGLMMMLNTHGIKEGSKVDKQDEAKLKGKGKRKRKRQRR